MDNNIFETYIEIFLACLAVLPVTLKFMFSSLFVGMIFAIPLAVIYARKITLGAKIVGGYVLLFTGTPLLVQIYVFYYGFADFKWVQSMMESSLFGFTKEADFWLFLSLMLNTCAYSVIILAGAINNTDRGELEAARALGFSKMQTLKHITLPSSFRRSLPAYSNEVVMMLHATSLASLVTITEMTNIASKYAFKHLEPFAPYIVCGFIYLCLTTLLVGGFRWLERRYLSYLPNQT